MDKKIKIKEEDPLADDIASLNEREFFHEVVSMKTSIGTLLVDTDCDMTVKTEVKSETPFIEHPVKQIKTKSATCSNIWEMHRETEIEHQTLLSDFGLHNEGEFLLEDPLMVDNKCNSIQMHKKIENKEKSWPLVTRTSSVCDNIKDGDFPPVNSSRLSTDESAEAITGKSPLLSAELPARPSSLCNEMDHFEFEYQKSDFTEILTAKQDVHSEQYGNSSDKVDTHIQPLFLKVKSLGRLSKRQQQCGICEKSFCHLSYLKAHILSHKGKSPHQCKVCDKRFTQLSSLKRHNLIHEGKKQHQCKVCDRSFTQLSTLKTHNLVHEGKKIHECKICSKSFTHLSTLKTHSLVHEVKKPHQCKVCDKSFTHLSNLKTHSLLHDGKKPHECKVCEKRFTHLSNLKTHNLVHEGKKLHQCKVCEKSFTQSSHLKRHHLIHEGKKPHQCKVCHKSFIELSALKRHTFVHKRK